MNETITYIAVDNNAPDFPRARGEGKNHLIAKLRCEIAIREKVISKIENSGNIPMDLVDDYIIKEEREEEC